MHLSQKAVRLFLLALLSLWSSSVALPEIAASSGSNNQAPQSNVSALANTQAPAELKSNSQQQQQQQQSSNEASPTPSVLQPPIGATRSPVVVRQLAQVAPYAIEGAQPGAGSSSGANGNTRNIMFRLNPNQQDTRSSQPASTGADPWSFISRNGTIIGTRVNFNLKKLLETLNNNNFTSEVKFDDVDGIVNITISNYRESASTSEAKSGLQNHATPIDELLLEELLIDSSSGKIPFSLANGGSVVKDNHRYESKYPLRAKPASIEAAVITAPPIRSAIEVVAENYTVRKIAEEANIFSVRLLNQLNIEKLGSRNLIQTPFAIYQGLALLLSGAMGDTAKELDKVLLGSQSPYENTKLTHDQDRARLLASLGDVIRQLQYSASHHLRPPIINETAATGAANSNNNNNNVVNHNNALASYHGGIADQHLIVANNLIFSQSAYEISNEFKNSLSAYYNNTVLSKVEIGSTESIQTINSWIRRATVGVIPSILDKKNTFDEFNVMALLCTSWLAQEWKDQFYKVSSPLRTNIRLKTGHAAQGKSLLKAPPARQGIDFDRAEPLLEFVDDNKQSHFVEYIKSRPTKNIHHYHSVLGGQIVDIVVVPFKDSNHRLITLTPADKATTNSANSSLQLQLAEQLSNLALTNSSTNPATNPTDSSQLSKLISTFSSNSRKMLRNLWNIIMPDLITKQTLQNIQIARQKNVTIDTIETSIIPLVQLSMPIIRTEADSSVSAALNHIGIVNSFDPDQANFIGINGHPFNYYSLHLSNVVAKTTFNMNERGINYDKTIKTLEALRIFPNRREQQPDQSSGKAEISIETDDEYIKLELIDDVKLNKPFMYLIYDIKTKLILYTGVVRNPTQEGP